MGKSPSALRALSLESRPSAKQPAARACHLVLFEPPERIARSKARRAARMKSAASNSARPTMLVTASV
jgi:hypothetical protein